MAVPLTPDQLVTALRAEGVKVVEVGSWRTHNRNHKGAWGPVHGIMHHHTVSSDKDPSRPTGSVELCRAGHSTLPGPLCHGVIAKDGTVYLVGYGRANHAGGGDPNVLQAVKDERYTDRPPVPQVANSAGVDGNPHFYGFESINLGDGKDPWPAAQVDAMVRVSAAISRAHRWQHQSSIAHREWKNDKPDPKGPGMPDMPTFRARIKERLAHAAGWSPSAPTPPTQGPALTKPNRLSVRRDENITLFPGTPVQLYWTTEFQDDANGHADNGKTLATNVAYSAVITPKVLGLAHGDHFEVYAVEEDQNGTRTGTGRPSQVWGQDMGQHSIEVNMAYNGIVGQRLSFEIVNRGDSEITLTEIQGVIFSWPNS